MFPTPTLAVVLLLPSLLALGACNRDAPAPPATSASPASAPATERVVGPLSPADAEALAPMHTRLAEYLQTHRTIEAGLPTLSNDSTPEQIDRYQRAFQQRMQTARAAARPGDIFTPEARVVIRRLLATMFSGPDGAQMKASIMDENPVDPVALKLSVNGRYPDGVPVATMPPQLLQTLPELSEDLEYRFIGDWLILNDTHAHVIADFIDNAIPQ